MYCMFVCMVTVGCGTPFMPVTSDNTAMSLLTVEALNKAWLPKAGAGRAPPYRVLVVAPL